MKKCPECNKEYPDYADTCPKCKTDLDTGLKIQENTEDKKRRRGHRLFSIGKYILIFNFIYAILSEGFGFNRPNFQFRGIYSILGIIIMSALPFGWIGLLLVWRGKKLLQKKFSGDFFYWGVLIIIASGATLFFLTAFLNILNNAR